MSFRFDEVHPATRLWWAQREQCEACAHCMLYEGRGGEGVMLCSATFVGAEIAYCIDARSDDKPCGPDARLFIPKGQS